jgi:hypothetical protein
MNHITTTAGDHVLLGGTVERSRGADLRVIIEIRDEETGLPVDRSAFAHVFSLFAPGAISGDTGASITAAVTGFGTTGGLHEAVIPAVAMGAVPAGGYWAEFECRLVGGYVEKYRTRVKVVGRGRKPDTDADELGVDEMLCNGIVLSNGLTGVAVALPAVMDDVDDYIVMRDWQEAYDRHDGEIRVVKEVDRFTILTTGSATGHKIGYRAVKVVTP